MASPRSHFRLLDLLTRYAPAQELVLRHLEIRDIIALSRTTKAFSGYVALVQRTQFDISEYLKPFVDDAIAFRALQAKHNILITGQFALSFMSRRSLDRDLEEASPLMLEKLVVEKGLDSDALKAFLVCKGYEVTGSPSGYLFMTRTSSRGKNAVWIHETEGTPLISIDTIELTCDVNFITWNKAYSVFAYTTFILKEGFLLQHPKDLAIPQIPHIWKHAGIDIAPIMLRDAYPSATGTESPHTSSNLSLLGNRLIGDKHSWIVTLDTSGIDLPRHPEHHINYAGFNVEASVQAAPSALKFSRARPFNHYVIQMTVLKSFSLRHQYAFAEEPLVEFYRFRDRTILQLYSLPVDQQPVRLTQIFAQRHSVDTSVVNGFVLPETWRYYDDEMLKMLEMRYPGAIRDR